MIVTDQAVTGASKVSRTLSCGVLPPDVDAATVTGGGGGAVVVVVVDDGGGVVVPPACAAASPAHAPGLLAGTGAEPVGAATSTTPWESEIVNEGLVGNESRYGFDDAVRSAVVGALSFWTT